VFKGAFDPKLSELEASAASFARDAAGLYHGLLDGHTYVLSVVEDEAAEEEARAAGPARSYRGMKQETRGTTAASRGLTEELKKLSTDELRDQSDRYKQLVEARDLEDVLYGGGS